MSFSFGFSGDDIEEDTNATSLNNNPNVSTPSTADSPPPIPARTHDLDELVGKNPQKIILQTMKVKTKFIILFFSYPTQFECQTNLLTSQM